MSINNFKPEIWSTRMLAMLQKALVYMMLCNTDYEGEIKQAGDTVRITGVGPVAIHDYDSDVDLTADTLDDEQLILKIDQQKYFNFQVEDVDAAQANVKVMSEGIRNATYAMRDVIDQFIASKYVEASSITNLTAVNSLNVLHFLLSLSQALTELDVPRENRVAVIPPWMTTKLVLAKIIVENSQNNDAFTNGYVGRAAGFDLYESNNVPTTNNGTEYKVVAGQRGCIGFANQLTKTEAYRTEKGFKDGVKGLSVYGAKVIYPDKLAVGDCTNLAEP